MCPWPQVYGWVAESYPLTHIRAPERRWCLGKVPLRISVDSTVALSKFKIEQKTKISHCLMGTGSWGVEKIIGRNLTKIPFPFKANNNLEVGEVNEFPRCEA